MKKEKEKKRIQPNQSNKLKNQKKSFNKFNKNRKCKSKELFQLADNLL